MRLCDECEFRVVCDVVDSAEIQFWPDERRLDEISRRLGRPVSVSEYQRVCGCLLRGRWEPGVREHCGSVEEDVVSCGAGVAEKTTAGQVISRVRGEMGIMLAKVPESLRERLGDEAAKALVDLVGKTATASDGGDVGEALVDKVVDKIKGHIDHGLKMLELRLKEFAAVVACVCVAFLTLFMLVLQAGLVARNRV